MKEMNLLGKISENKFLSNANVNFQKFTCSNFPFLSAISYSVFSLICIGQKWLGIRVRGGGATIFVLIAILAPTPGLAPISAHYHILKL